MQMIAIYNFLGPLKKAERRLGPVFQNLVPGLENWS